MNNIDDVWCCCCCWWWWWWWWWFSHWFYQALRVTDDIFPWIFLRPFFPTEANSHTGTLTRSRCLRFSTSNLCSNSSCSNRFEEVTLGQRGHLLISFIWSYGAPINGRYSPTSRRPNINKIGCFFQKYWTEYLSLSPSEVRNLKNFGDQIKKSVTFPKANSNFSLETWWQRETILSFLGRKVYFRRELASSFQGE